VDTERVTGTRPPPTTYGQSREMEIKPDADVAERRREAQFIPPVPVSRSSYLFEKDKHFRNVETVQNANDVAKRAAHCILDFDHFRETEAGGASPQAQAIVNGFEQALGHIYAMVIMSSGSDSTR
jgi:hypothetical protein